MLRCTQGKRSSIDFVHCDKVIDNFILWCFVLVATQLTSFIIELLLDESVGLSICDQCDLFPHHERVFVYERSATPRYPGSSIRRVSSWRCARPTSTTDRKADLRLYIQIRYLYTNLLALLDQKHVLPSVRSMKSLNINAIGWSRERSRLIALNRRRDISELITLKLFLLSP